MSEVSSGFDENYTGLVGCQGVIASRLAPTVGLGTSGRNWLAVRPPSRASPLPQVLSTSARYWSAGRPPSRAGSLLQKSKGRAAYTHASNHSTGRALARLQLLILIHPPPRQAEWRRSSGGGRAAPFGEAEHIERRSKRSRPEAMPPDECRSEGTPSLSEGPYVRGERFFAYFF
ncbi:hypothetical protein D3C72_1511680 [compost metagenome]